MGIVIYIEYLISYLYWYIYYFYCIEKSLFKILKISFSYRNRIYTIMSVSWRITILVMEFKQNWIIYLWNCKSS